MRRMGTVFAALALATAGLAAPAATAQASTKAAGCADLWPGRNGNVYAWRDVDCGGTRLGATAGNDLNWHDGSGEFTGSDGDNASSVMNAGFTGGRDVVAFYRNAGGDHTAGYGCLAPGELYADWLGDNRYFVPGTGQISTTMENTISSHVWVYAAGCPSGSWIT